MDFFSFPQLLPSLNEVSGNFHHDSYDTSISCQEIDAEALHWHASPPPMRPRMVVAT